ncbi:MAG: hypothetical protein DI556_18235 [Rhodovulum sulfidophilum]|uniref:Lipoprotein n=1 Tax=Rhodovulum sulfidophilum TaxID=35806 RepID=A0A2W5N188_RHOSU|nr:MAG: hypothetical protein DI556_18235 [Rhodovulum sulfidophilum]
MPRLGLPALAALFALAACAAPALGPAQSRAVSDACRVAVAAAAGVPVSEVTPLDLMAGGAGIEARMVVGGARAPWACFADRTGTIRGVEYTAVFP